VPVAELVERLANEYQAARKRLDCSDD